MRRAAWMVVATAGLSLLLASCSEAELPERSLRRDDCLREVHLNQLQQALKRCNAVVAHFPMDPQPRSERSVLLALTGDDNAACRDIEAAHALVQRSRAGRLDPLLVSELEVRRRSCRGNG